MKWLIPVLFFTSPAFAEPYCGDRGEIVQNLLDVHGESQVSMGISQDRDVLVETFVNDRTGTFTIIVTGVDGMSCVAVFGDNYITAKGETF